MKDSGVSFIHQEDDLIITALKEDVGCGDITTALLVDPAWMGRAKVIAKQEIVLAGAGVFRRVFQLLSPEIKFLFFAPQGSIINKGDMIAELTGPFDALLTGERTALNFLQHLSSIATITRSFSGRLKNTKAVLLDTRKTTPAWRLMEKEAVRMGGGQNHRMGLFDAVLIKENHIAGCGGVSAAIAKVKELKRPHVKIEIEVRNLQELKEAIEAGPDMIMLDNMCIEDMMAAVELTAGRITLEASGNVTIERIEAIALTGVDYISVGAITHSAGSVDMTMLIEHDG